MPALLKRTSIRLSRFTTLATSATVSSSSVTSTCSATALPPALRIAATVAFAPRSSTSATTTRAPSLANSRAVTRRGGCQISSTRNIHRIDEMLVHMVDELAGAVVKGAANRNVVEDRKVLDVLAKANTAGMGTD